jgi:K+-sensing histidine kinase KdpD
MIHEALRAMGIFNLMVVPLAASQTILGVLLLGSHNPEVLTGEDLALFTSIGQQLGLALRNAQLLRSASEMEALREADRLKSGFLAGVSHDLRSPLTAIRASVESLLDRESVQSTWDQEHLLQNIAGQAGRLGRLVDQLLDLSRIEAGAFSLDRDWTELPVLIADSITKFEELNSGCKVEQNLQVDLPLHYVDPNYLVQVLWNLLENAFKYGTSSSRITVDARWTGTDVLIGVADRGPGIPAGEREHIFQPFYRLNRDHKSHTAGSGLGLAICRGIVEAHGGQIWVEDRPGGGSAFRISLPLPTTAPLELDTMESLNCAV